jgi:ribonucleoside-triphosphate reductase (thioredoxin)
MSIKALQDYTVYARYAKYLETKGRRETWKETVNRMFYMHERKYSKQLEDPEFRELFEETKKAVQNKLILGAQRALQFGGEPIEKHNARMFNCAFTHCDRPKVFGEIMYLLLCGCGVGFSVQTHHVQMLQDIKGPLNSRKKFIIKDSIEGWADGIQALVDSYFNGTELIEFDFSEIRPEGAMISGGFKAPGPKGLKASLEKIDKVLKTRLDYIENLQISKHPVGPDEFWLKLRPIDVYDIIMHSSDAVLSGGVRRSATLSLFSKDDTEMLEAKTGDWFVTNPQRGRSNNSAALLKNDTTREEFSTVMKSTRQFGEPGFIWLDDLEIGYNPCVEIGLFPKTEDGRSGFQFCNLTSINASKCKSRADFYLACKTSAVLGTLQAGYTDFKYVSDETREITEREALLGCSITGVMENPDVILNKKIQVEGAQIIKEVNKQIAKIIGINTAARTTTLKPEGTSSCILGTSSGIHPHHAKRYIRRVQANKMEFPAQHFAENNPLAVEDSVWSNSGTDVVISFLCEVPIGSITKNQISAIELLDKVKLTQQNWVAFGKNDDLCVNNKTSHNVSNTITVKDDEWEEVEKYIYDNRSWFAGISLLPYSGDLDYPQAPFSTVLLPNEIVKQYGDGSMFASGIIVDGLKAFKNNLWTACDAILGRGLISLDSYTKGLDGGYVPDGSTGEDFYEQSDWVRRGLQFAERYFDGNVTKMTHCLKHVLVWKNWCDLKREYTDIDWSVVQEEPYYVNIDTTGAQACAGGKCEL